MGDAGDSVITRMRKAWSRFRCLTPCLDSRVFPLRAEIRLYSECVRSVMLYGSETWPIKEQDVMKLKMNDIRIVKWMCNVRSGNVFRIGDNKCLVI